MVMSQLHIVLVKEPVELQMMLVRSGSCSG